MTGLREYASTVSPPWLRRVWGLRYLYALAAPFDAMIDGIANAVKCASPGFDDVADRYLGFDRGIPRGPSETSDQYAERLKGWREAKSKAGTSLELLRQLHGYLKDDDGLSLTVSMVCNGTGATAPRYWIYDDGEEGYSQSSTGWNGDDWDGRDDLWARFWIVINCSGRYSRATTWALAGDREERSLGSTMPVSVCAGIRTIIEDWRAAHAVMVSVILRFDDSGSLAPSDWGRIGDRNGLFCYFGPGG